METRAGVHTHSAWTAVFMVFVPVEIRRQLAQVYEARVFFLR
jgi:hypothetical protein